MAVATFSSFSVVDGQAYGFDESGLETFNINLKDYNKIHVTKTLWIVNRDFFRLPYSKDLVNTLPKLDIANVKEIKIDRQVFKIEDIKKFQSVEEAKLYNNDIKNEDGTNADPADIFKLLKNVKRFNFRHESNMFKKETAANLIKEPNFAKLEQLILHNVSPDFDINVFLNGIKKFHPNINCNIFFKKDFFGDFEFDNLKKKLHSIPPTMFPNLRFSF